MSSDMYKEIILDYYRNPRNKGRLQDPDTKAKDSNPLCGDVVEMQLKFADGKVSGIMFNGDGCAISQASASMLTELVMGKSIEEVRKIDKTVLLENLGSPNLGAVRIKCALLPLKVMKSAVYEYLGEKMTAQDE
ncbi:MAG: SUF system NifU family Fe-S cluster assembly protein [Nitrososphaerota archaeon]|nr:SUF system NifU family Fe-S cluster assembly protein [Nitrososphaerota archaeon]MDG6922601.1 SUF system NifU family Fe-S cluster assembly protein [Nitrososphaerota archaeon]